MRDKQQPREQTYYLLKENASAADAEVHITDFFRMKNSQTNLKNVQLYQDSQKIWKGILKNFQCALGI